MNVRYVDLRRVPKARMDRITQDRRVTVTVIHPCDAALLRAALCQDAALIVQRCSAAMRCAARGNRRNLSTDCVSFDTARPSSGHCMAVMSSVNPSLRPSICPSLCQSVRPSIRSSLRPFDSSSVRLSARLSIHSYVLPSRCHQTSVRTWRRSIFCAASTLPENKQHFS